MAQWSKLLGTFLFCLFLLGGFSEIVYAGEMATAADVVKKTGKTSEGIQYTYYVDKRYGVCYKDPKTDVEELSFAFVQVDIYSAEYIVETTSTGNFYAYAYVHTPDGRKNAYTAYNNEGLAASTAKPVYTPDSIFCLETVGWKFVDTSYQNKTLWVPFPGQVYSYTVYDAQMKANCTYETFELSKNVLLGLAGLADEEWSQHILYYGANFQVSAIFRCSADGQETWSSKVSMKPETGQAVFSRSESFYSRRSPLVSTKYNLTGSKYANTYYTDSNLQDLLLYYPKYQYEILHISPDGTYLTWKNFPLNTIQKDGITYSSVWTIMSTRMMAYMMNRSLRFNGVLSYGQKPALQQVSSGIYWNAAEAQVEMRSSEYDLTRGIPTGEPVTVQVGVMPFYVKGTVRKITDWVNVECHLDISFNTKVKSEKYYYYQFSYQIPGKLYVRYQGYRSYTYWDLGDLDLFVLSKVKAEHGALDNPMDWQQGIALSYTYIQPDSHIQKGEVVKKNLYYGTINARVDLGVKALGESYLGSVQGRSDTLQVAGEWIVSDAGPVTQKQKTGKVQLAWTSQTKALIPNGEQKGAVEIIYNNLLQTGQYQTLRLSTGSIFVHDPVVAACRIMEGEKETTLLEPGRTYQLFWGEAHHRSIPGFGSGLFEKWIKNRQVVFSFPVEAEGKVYPAGSVVDLEKKTALLFTPLEKTETALIHCQVLAVNAPAGDVLMELGANLNPLCHGAYVDLVLEWKEENLPLPEIEETQPHLVPRGIY